MLRASTDIASIVGAHTGNHIITENRIPWVVELYKRIRRRPSTGLQINVYDGPKLQTTVRFVAATAINALQQMMGCVPPALQLKTHHQATCAIGTAGVA
jgi:hypothetical protein